MCIRDRLCVFDEELDDTQPYLLFDPNFTWKRKMVKNYVAKDLMVQVFDKGRLVYDLPTVQQIREYCAQQQQTLWDEEMCIRDSPRGVCHAARQEARQAVCPARLERA